MANVCIRQAERIPANDQDDKATLARALEVAEALARVTRLFGATSQDEQCRPGATSLGPLRTTGGRTTPTA